MMIKSANLFAGIPETLAAEQITGLLLARVKTS
jgi:hypothetical protein